MNKKEAINILKERQESLKTTYGNEFPIWKNHTISWIKDFFGEDSTEYAGVLQLQYLRIIDAEYNIGSGHVINKTEKNTDINTAFLENCIKKITVSGLYKKPKNNFLRKLSDAWLIAIITMILTVIFPVIFWAGFWFGKHDSIPSSNQKSNQESPHGTDNNKNGKH